MILNAKKNPNFSSTVKYLDIELPEQVRPVFMSNLYLKSLKYLLKVGYNSEFSESKGPMY